MKRLSLVLMLLIIGSCAPPPLVLNNRGNLIKLAPGMSKEQVLQNMGLPYRNDAFTADTGTLIEVYFYQTEARWVGIANSSDGYKYETTPLVIVDGGLVGWGWSFYEDTTQKYDIKINLD